MKPTTRPEARGQVEAALGARFRKVRKTQKVTLLDLAQRLGCSVNTVRWHEAGARMMRVDDIVRAAEIIGVDPAELTRLEETA